ncbi:HAD-IB family phosphatase, partial [Candidatus Woesearchaeota archaeon]|nr:HAD-IB family phosphatase [Candidatus Woesearchaeota archaeon]
EKPLTIKPSYKTKTGMKRKYDLVCFDLDGTLIEEKDGKVFWERVLSKIYGSNIVSMERWGAWENGKLTLLEWVDLDVGDWKRHGFTKKKLQDLINHSSLLPGSHETLKELKDKGFKLGVISGSVNILLDTVFPKHPFDDIFIHNIFFGKDNKISHWEKNPYAEKKDEALKIIAKKENIPLSKTVFIGDHHNDISVAKIAGLSISINSKSKELDEVCDVVIKKKDMSEILKHII